jgi:hypothetical protein
MAGIATTIFAKPVLTTAFAAISVAATTAFH